MVVHALPRQPKRRCRLSFHDPAGRRHRVDTEAALFPRTDIAQAGLAPLTSMYLFGPNDRQGFDDWRARCMIRPGWNCARAMTNASGGP